MSHLQALSTKPEPLLLRGNGNRHEGMANKSVRDSINNALTILASGGDVGTNGTESLGTSLSAEGAGDFLFELDHAHIPLGLVVVKRDAEIVHKCEYLGFVGLEAVEEILGFGLFGFAPA